MFSSEGSLPNATLQDEILATAGFDFAVTPRVTMSFDVLSRTVLRAGQMHLAEKTFEFAGAGTGGAAGGGGGGGGGGGQPTPPATVIRSVTKTELQFDPGNLQLYLGAAGIRFNPWRTVLVTANLLFPITDSGLRDRVTPVVGIDYVF